MAWGNTMDSRPFFERIRMPEPGGTYFEVTNSGRCSRSGRGRTSRAFRAASTTGSRGSTRAPGAWIEDAPWTIEEENWWEPRPGAGCSVVDRTSGEIFLFSQGTWPLQETAASR